MARRAAAAAAEKYDVHPSVHMVTDWVAALPAKTGRSIEQWMAFIKKQGPATEAGRRDWLKREHAMGTNTAWWLAERSVGKGGEADTPEGYLVQAAAYVQELYAKKADLWPLHQRLVKLARACGKDVKICPCKTMVQVYREHVIAQIKPSTRTRIDLGLSLGPLLKAGKKIPARLIDTGGFAKKDRLTHRIEITSDGDIDGEVERWLMRAYELDA